MEYRPLDPPEDDSLSFEMERMLIKAKIMLAEAREKIVELLKQGHVEGLAGSYNVWKHEIDCYKRYMLRIEKIEDKIYGS